MMTERVDEGHKIYEDFYEHQKVKDLIFLLLYQLFLDIKMCKVSQIA